MKFYTVQSIEFWENNKNNKYLKNKYLKNDYNYVYEDMALQYKWMYNQMKNRLEEVDESMIWVWPKRPDLRLSGYSARGDECVLLQLELHESQVLLSDFEMWHLPLMNMVVTKYDDENIEKEKSWERVFDFDTCLEIYKIAEEEDAFLKGEKYEPNENMEIIKQGVTSKVNLENVKLIRTFKAK